MIESKCPVCGCKVLFVKDQEDEYELYEFECKDGKICFDSDVNDSEAPEIESKTEVYCTKCSWHDKFKKLISDN